MKMLFIDLETTGTEPGRHGVVQIAGIIEIDGKVVEEFELKSHPFPGQTYDSEALRVIGKTEEEIGSYPEPHLAYKAIVCLFNKYIDRYNKADKLHMVGQNPRFDYDFLTAFFQNNGDKFLYAYIKYHLIDLIAATALFQAAGKIKVPNMKLETVSSYFGIEYKAHDAKEDVRITRKLYYTYVNLIKQIVMPTRSKEASI